MIVYNKACNSCCHDYNCCQKLTNSESYRIMCSNKQIGNTKYKLKYQLQISLPLRLDSLIYDSSVQIVSI